MRSVEDWENEWATLEADLEGIASGGEIQKMKKRTLHSPVILHGVRLK